MDLTSTRILSDRDTIIRDRIREFIFTRFLEGEDPANLTDATPLVTGGVINSLSSIEMGAFLEETFGVILSPDELSAPEHMETIDSIAALVASKLPRGQANGVGTDAR